MLWKVDPKGSLKGIGNKDSFFGRHVSGYLAAYVTINYPKDLTTEVTTQP